MELVIRLWSAVSVTLLVLGMFLWLIRPLAGGVNGALAAGLVLLLVTPVLKLLSVLIDETRARDWRFVALGVGVLSLLGGSVALAFLA